MGLFSPAQIDQINKVAAKSKEVLQPSTSIKNKSINTELNAISQNVIEYFKDSKAILITSLEDLHNYIDLAIDSGYAGIDTETTGLDRVRDYIVGASLYYPGGVECYIPMKHIVPIFDEPYKNQLTYEQVSQEFQRLANSNIKLIFANADFDLAMIYKDLKVDLCDRCYYDVILAWRCLKENEKNNQLKVLYNKYVLKGKGDPKTFSDFFPVQLFPYCKPEVAKLYAANDAKITYELFTWQLPYVTKSHHKCKKAKLEAIADLIWNIEFPLITVCQRMHRNGMYLDKTVSNTLVKRYNKLYDAELEKLSDMVQDIIENADYHSSTKRPFLSGKDFNPSSPKHVQYLLYTIMKLPVGKEGAGTGKEILGDLNLPVTNQILKVRSISVLINTFVNKLPASTTSDSRIHAQFKSVGADCITGDSILPTSSGYRTIGEICNTNNCKEAEHVDVENLIIVNKNQHPESVQSVIRYTNYPTIRITTECGFTLEGTYNHPIMVSKYTSNDNITLNKPKILSRFWEDRYFKRLDEISVGDYVEIPCNYSIGPTEYVKTNFVLHPKYNTSRTNATLPQVYDENFAEFLGIYHADGSASIREGTYTISISNDDKDVISRVDDLSISLFNVPTSHYTAQSDNNEVETYINCMQIKDIDQILNHGKQHKKIPEAIWRSPKSVINSYIKGLTLDSSVYLDENGRVSLEISVINDADARMIQYHLASQGILCYMGHNENKGGWLTPRLRFNADNYILFRDIVGFVESKKYRETEGCAKNKYISRRIDNSFRLKVKSIEYSTNTVYDLHVPGTHSFISNGFISHNTGRMSSAEPNMQNIPSHATDIRHMFRATAASQTSVDCNYDSSLNLISVCLNNCDSVYTKEGEKKVSDLVVGDLVKLINNNEEVYKHVKQLEDSNTHLGVRNVIF